MPIFSDGLAAIFVVDVRLVIGAADIFAVAIVSWWQLLVPSVYWPHYFLIWR